MIIYILAIPVFSFFIPIYSFWHFDDFSWGNTRIVVGEKGEKKAVGPDEGVFDPSTIPLKRWSEYEEMKRQDEENSQTEEEMTQEDKLIYEEIERIFEEYDLMEISRKKVRDILSETFQMDMTCKKEFINDCIDRILS